jgi:DNA-binding NarL/FixJ family response regulator
MPAGRPDAQRFPPTPRQREIMALIVQGLSNKEIARRLKISEGTVKAQLHIMYERFGVRNRAALAALIFTHRAD